MTTEKSFDSGRYLHSKIHAEIQYIAHTIEDTMQIFNETPYIRIVNNRIEYSTICIERNSCGWSFKGVVQIPPKYQSFGVGRTAFNLLLKQAIVMAGDAPFVDKLEPGNPGQHLVRDLFYKNIGFHYDGNHFKIDRVDKLKIFNAIKGVPEIDAKEELFVLHKTNEELIKSLAITKEEAIANNTRLCNIQLRHDRCNSQRFWCILTVLMLAAAYALLR